MCRLGGVILPREDLGRQAYRNIQRRLEDLLVHMDMAQGGDGVGIAVAGWDGSIAIAKSPERAWRALKSRSFREALNLDRLRGAYSVQLHARLATQGSSENPANLHPFVCGPIVGAHNGVIYNDEEVWAIFDGTKPQGQCDSEAIFHVLGIHARDLGNPTDIACGLDWVAGSLAISAISLKAPGRVLLVSRENPLAMAYQEKMIWYASTEDLLETSSGWRRHDYHRTETAVQFPFETGRLIDAATLGYVDFEVPDSFSYKYYYRTGWAWDDDEDPRRTHSANAGKKKNKARDTLLAEACENCAFFDPQHQRGYCEFHKERTGPADHCYAYVSDEDLGADQKYNRVPDKEEGEEDENRGNRASA